jgi:hypothetical protein
MSESKTDRSTAPRDGTRRSRAKQAHDRNIKPPKAKRTAARKPKKGARVMEAQLAKQPPPTSLIEHDEPAETLAEVVVDPDEVPEVKDPWWTDEREKAFAFAMQGFPKSQIARELGRERHAIARWMEDERFETRMYEENLDRFKTSRQRRTMQTLRLTDKAQALADKMIDIADENPKDLNARLAARDWLNEFREQSRREDEIYGLDKQRVDVNVHGTIQHKHKGTVDVSFKNFLLGSMKRLGVDVDSEEIDAGRADEALVAITERALMEGTFLEDLVAQEKEQALLLAEGR